MRGASRWRQQLSDGTLSELERECLSECLQVLSNLRPLPGAVLRPPGLSPHQQRHGAQHSRPQNAVSPHQWSQELERLSVALRALCGVCASGGSKMRPIANNWSSSAARLDRTRWRELRRETTVAQHEQLTRFRFCHKRQAFLASFEERWADAAPPHSLP